MGEEDEGPRLGGEASGGRFDVVGDDDLGAEALLERPQLHGEGGVAHELANRRPGPLGHRPRGPTSGVPAVARCNGPTAVTVGDQVRIAPILCEGLHHRVEDRLGALGRRERHRRHVALPNVRCAGGSWLVPEDAVLAGDWDRITELAKQAVAGSGR